jgi:superfamily II DNA/RNA helicase
VPTILAGKDVVLLAETGSGKTLAYLAPVAQMLLANQPPEAAPEDAPR